MELKRFYYRYYPLPATYIIIFAGASLSTLIMMAIIKVIYPPTAVTMLFDIYFACIMSLILVISTVWWLLVQKYYKLLRLHLKEHYSPPKKIGIDVLPVGTYMVNHIIHMTKKNYWVILESDMVFKISKAQFKEKGFRQPKKLRSITFLKDGAYVFLD